MGTRGGSVKLQLRRALSHAQLWRLGVTSLGSFCREERVMARWLLSHEGMKAKLLPLLIGVQSFAIASVFVGVLATHAFAGPPAVKKPVALKPTAAKEPEPEVDPKVVIRDLFEGNERFAAGLTRPHDMLHERHELETGQHPNTMVLSCSDSRVPPELVFDKTLGELFVVRSAGNVADKFAIGSLEYAAEHLHAKVLVVLGHEKCGAVTAAASGAKMPTENLTALMNEIAPKLSTLKATFSGDELVHHGVESNVSGVAQELIEHSPIIRELVEKGELTIVRAVYELDSGRVRRLDPTPVAAALSHDEPQPVHGEDKAAHERALHREAPHAHATH